MSAVKEASLVGEIDSSVKYAYVLISTNPRRGGVYDENGAPVREQEYKTNLNILFKSSIIWPGGIDPFTVDANGNNGKQRNAGKYFISYYDGCTTLFEDSQPQDKPTIDALKLATESKYFNHGSFFVEGYDRMLKLFMDWTSLNESSPYRNPASFPKFKSVLPGKELTNEGERMDMEDQATEIAKTAPIAKMISHANYLEIAMEDSITGVKYSNEVIRIAYRKKAKENPRLFIDSYSDATMEFKYKIKKLIEGGKLSTSLIPNVLSWVNNGQTVINISGLESIENIVKKAAEFGLSEEGADFKERVNSIS